jgi:hypothetical protein
LLAPVKTNRAALLISLGLHGAVLGALLISFSPAATPQNVTRISLVSTDSVARTISLIPTPAQIDKPALRPRQTPLPFTVAAGPVSSTLQTNDTLALPRKPRKIDFERDASTANAEPRVRLFADVMLPDDLLGADISVLRARISLDPAGQPTKIEWLTEFASVEQMNQLTELLMASFFVPFSQNGVTVAGVGLLELQRGGFAATGQSPVVTPITTAEQEKR